VQSGGERTYRICSYDRANLGRSEKASKPRTFLDMARDLHVLLANAQIKGSYILVGHSMGGFLVRVFRDQYPEEVVGLVLEDAAHPDMGMRLMEGLPPRSVFESQAVRTTRAYFNWMSTSNGRTPNDPEGVDLLTSNAQVHAVKPPGNLPLVVISRSPDNPSFPYSPDDLPAETNAALRQIWQDLQGELVGLSTSSTQVIAARAGHSISRAEPGLVIDVVDEARGRMVETGQSILPAGPSDPPAHAPRLLRVEQRLDSRKDVTFIHEDIYFVDDAGDAVFFKIKVISVDPMVDYSLSDDIVTAAAEEQKQGARLTSSFASTEKVTYVMEGQMVDQAYNLSEPIRYTLEFPAVQR
jgi:pimeloyl-ACP methyl ester carboxylesterase